MRIYDITRSLTPETAVWPGDTPFTQHWASRIDQGGTVNLSAATFSLHAGTHADAPLHFLADGGGIESVPLDRFIGPAWVVEVEREADAITPEHIQFSQFSEQADVRRVLFKTRSSDVPDTQWDPHFVPILPKTVAALAEKGVVLVGTDAPSVDPPDSKALSAHKALAQHGIVNLENLALGGIEPGLYHLVALPLKLHGLDAAPLRAVLMRL